MRSALPDFCKSCYDEPALLEHWAEVHGLPRFRLPDADHLPSYSEWMEFLSRAENASSSPAHLLAEKYYLWQFLNREFIAALAARLKQITRKAVVEVGAGDGLLSHWLRNYGVAAVATDPDVSGHNHWVKNKQRHEVLEVGALYAGWLARSNRLDTIIASWVPYRDNWDARMLAIPGIRRVVWIGEGEGGCCGGDHIWRYPHEQWSDVSAYAICRTDYSFSSSLSSFSHTGVWCFEDRGDWPSFKAKLLAWLPKEPTSIYRRRLNWRMRYYSRKFKHWNEKHQKEKKDTD